MDPTRPERPASPGDGGRGDPSVQRRGRAFLTSLILTWAAVILLGIVMLAVIIGFAAS